MHSDIATISAAAELIAVLGCLLLRQWPYLSTMSPAIARSTLVRSAATRTVARRQMSTAPKLHKSSDKWSEFVSKRPPKDELDTHVR